jgi:putative DNA primase/helicase
MIPIVFKAKFEGTAIKHNLDKRILAAEAPGVLRWMVEGCLKWQRDGRLIVPASIEAERAGYRKETDILGQWIAERCELDPTAVAQQASLFDSYRCWMQDENYQSIGSRTAFGRKLEGRGFPRGENEKGRTVQGLRLKTAGDSW